MIVTNDDDIAGLNRDFLSHSGPTDVLSFDLSEADRPGIVAQIVVSGPRMSAADNILGHTVTYLDAQITNAGTRVVSQVQLEMEFVDTLGQVVLRETNRPVNLQTPALKPGEARTFQVSFEHMPLEWNQAPPSICVKLVSFR